MNKEETFYGEDDNVPKRVVTRHQQQTREAPNLNSAEYSPPITAKYVDDTLKSLSARLEAVEEAIKELDGIIGLMLPPGSRIIEGEDKTKILYTPFKRGV